jgi:hypothetical protein
MTGTIPIWSGTRPLSCRLGVAIEVAGLVSRIVPMASQMGCFISSGKSYLLLSISLSADFGWCAVTNGIRRYIPRYDTPCTDDRASANCHVAHEHCAKPNQIVALESNRRLSGATLAEDCLRRVVKRMVVSNESDIAGDEYVIADLECCLDVHAAAEPHSIADMNRALSCKN